MDRSDNRTLAAMFQALAVDTRLEILRVLSSRTLCVGALSNLLGLTPGAVSQHLRILRNAGLVEADRRGQFVHYRLAPGAPQLCAEALQSIFGKKPASAKGTPKCAARKRNAKGRKR